MSLHYPELNKLMTELIFKLNLEMIKSGSKVKVESYRSTKRESLGSRKNITMIMSTAGGMDGRCETHAKRLFRWQSSKPKINHRLRGWS